MGKRESAYKILAGNIILKGILEKIGCDVTD
jgi:hypothetical protein